MRNISKNDEIHYLVHELLPMYDELDGEVKRIVDEHIQQCEICTEEIKIILSNFGENKLFNKKEEDSEFVTENPKPFKRLIQFKRIIFSASLAIRLLLLVMITYFATSYWPSQGAIITSDLILFYFPYVAIVDAIHFIFFKNKYFWVLLAFDILILLYFDDLLRGLVIR